MSDRDALQIRSTVGPLRPFIQQIWSARPARRQVQRCYPDGRHGLSVDLTTGQAWLEPAALTFGDVQLEPDALQCGLRFSAGGVVGLLGIEPYWGPERVPLLDVAPDFGEALDQMLDDPSHALIALERWLDRRARRASTPSRALATAVDWLTRADAGLQVTEVADEIGCSVRQLQRRFRAEVGISPKQMARVHRARLARTAIAADPQRPLVEVAAELDFADQAQMTKLFGRYCGTTPGRYRRRKLAEARTTA